MSPGEGATLGRVPDWLKNGLKHPMAAAAAMTLGIRFGQDAYKLRSGEMGAEEFKRRAGAHIGSLSGTAAGVLAGVLVGRLVPGVGRLAGAFAGGLFGELAGEHLGRKGAERLQGWLGRDRDGEPK